MAGNEQPTRFYFTETDAAFNVVLHAMKELREQGRLEIRHAQRATIQNTEGNDLDTLTQKFGGTAMRASHAFGRTASAVTRMCMLRAVNVESSWWPTFGKKAQERNRKKMETEESHGPGKGPDIFQFTNDFQVARELWSRYDHLYPHFLVEEKASGPIGTQISLNRMMFVFRKNFSEVVELTTNLDVTPRPNKEFDSYVSVVCVVRGIKPARKRAEDGKFTQELKWLMSVTTAVDPTYFEDLKFLDVNQDLKDLEDPVSAYFQGLQLEDEEGDEDGE